MKGVLPKSAMGEALGSSVFRNSSGFAGCVPASRHVRRRRPTVHGSWLGWSLGNSGAPPLQESTSVEHCTSACGHVGMPSFACSPLQEPTSAASRSASELPIGLPSSRTSGRRGKLPSAQDAARGFRSRSCDRPRPNPLPALAAPLVPHPRPVLNSDAYDFSDGLPIRPTRNCQHSQPAPGRVMAQSDHRAFQQHVGRAVGEEIDRQRIEHAKKLVRETRQKLHVIPRLSGFSGAERFSRTFHRVTGAPPSAYRRRSDLV